ncbi:MAG: metalloregulator ArsR/SmtB family transcription factor [Trueperaceae bacterium]|nr:metalloregulator ArsR/SmtB family transcription factor [Trueperaceae bacterium]
MGDPFHALAAPARRAILGALRVPDEQTLFELCSRLTMVHGVNLTRQAVSQHLEVLEDAGLVRTRTEGRYEFHSLDPAPLRGLLGRWLDEP